MARRGGYPSCNGTANRAFRAVVAFAVLATCLVSTGGCPKSLPPTMVPDEILLYSTEDGWEGDVRHYAADGPPVLLVHGMGANHYNFDYREEVSLAHALRQAGWDVYVPELRGDPGSRAPSRRALRSFTFDDHALRDLPAIVDLVLAESGEDRLFWVGHSMGGMLLYTALSRYPERIEAGVAICSPVELHALTGLHRKLRGMAWAVRGRGRMPAVFFAKLSLPLGRRNPLYARLANKDNLDFPTANGLARRALVDMPRPMALQVVRWLRAGEFTTVEGEPWVKPAAVPLLVMGGAVDRVVPEPNVAAACGIHPDCTYRMLGVAGGFSTDYGHIDPVVGKTASTEIYPLVLSFLEAHVPVDRTPEPPSP